MSVRLVPALAALVALAPGVAVADPPSAQQDEAGTTAPPRLLEQVVLDYPPDAEPDQHGDVTIRVTVDVSGWVTHVDIVEGPEVFHGVAREAGAMLRFAPALQGGVPVASQAVVYFHFAPPEPIDDVDPGPDEEVVVHGDDPDVEDTHARTTLDAEALDRSASRDLAETVTEVPGVTLARGTADAAKPVIRGQPERRLLVLYDGVRHESQKWGPDHATEIDPFSAGEISVIRGAAGARYGPDAIGGVILVTPPPMRDEPGAGGKALGSFSSNGLRGYGAARLDVVPIPGLSLRVEGNYGRGASPSAPDYVLGNTGSELWNLGGAARYAWGDTAVRATWHHYDLRAGVFYGVQTSSPDAFEAQLQADRPVSADLWSTTYAIDRPYQDVQHDVATLHLDREVGWGALAATYAFQVNRRREYEQVRGSITGPQYDFLLRTHSLDLLARHDAVAAGRAWLTGGVGAQGSFQENVYEGLPLVPNFRGLGGGVFAWERLSFPRLDLELGGRVDHLSRTAWLGRQDYERHVRRDSLDEDRCDYDGEVARCPSAWDTGSASLGALVHLVPDRVDLKLDLSSASRFPNTDELYLIGNAPTFPVFALGYPELGVETTLGASVTLGVNLPWLEVEGSAFANRVDQYVYFAPDLLDGSIGYEVTVRGSFPRYAFRPIDAAFYGADGSVRLAPEAVVGLDARAATVRASDLGAGTPLVGIPADHARLALVGRPPGTRAVRDPQLSVLVDLVARQTRTLPSADFAPPPDGYALLGATASARLHFGRREVTVGLEGTNLTNARYREYTSLLRYYADQPGRDVRAWASVEI